MNADIARWGIISTLCLAGMAQGGDLSNGGDPDRHRQVDYRVINLSSLGGTRSSGNSINDQGVVGGYSNLAGDQERHATVWFYGMRFDLGTLGGKNSNIVWPVKNQRGIIAGIAQTAEPDPNNEAWSCSAFFPEATARGTACRGFVWEWGVMRALPTLGGTHGFATGANNRGQVVGWAENTVRDPTCVAPDQVLQFRAVVWGPGKNQLRELPVLPGDSTTAATAINDRGQIVGISGICDNAVGRFSARHAVLWQNGTIIDIGNLGGVAWNTAMAINERGDIVGFSNTSVADGGRFRARAFLWTKREGIRPLGTLPGDVLSQALGINDRRQIVGLSCTAGFASCRAFLWQNGVMRDLNEMVPGYADHLHSANDINNDGKITGYAIHSQTTAEVAFIALPIERHRHGGDSNEQVAMAATRGSGDSRMSMLPEHARKRLLRQLGVTPADLVEF